MQDGHHDMRKELPSARASPSRGLGVAGASTPAASPAKRAVSPVKSGSRPWDKLWSMEYRHEGK